MAKARFQPLPHRGEVAGGVGVDAFDDAVVVVKVPPDRSSGRTVPARTLSATLAMDRMRSGIPNVAASRMTGTISPLSLSTAIPRWTAPW
ncbi:hypothetical protein I1A62_08590 [Rhodococcus sp. USK10]|nr:hypothetical protein I1A62_08590 [Rhodococcus sp. USK10]